MRRHLTSSQAVMAEAKRVKLCQQYAIELERLKQDAQKRQRKGKGPDGSGGRGRAKTSGNKLSEVYGEHPTDTVRAKGAGTNRTYVAEAERLLDQAPDLAEQVTGGTLTIPQARTELQRREKRKEYRC